VTRDRNQENYINGGNLIVTKEFFSRIGGFHPEYRTGEDVRFCQDAVENGGRILKVDAISAVHHGYPKTVRDFFKRERWHGLGMKHYLLRPWQLKDLILAMYFLILTAFFLLLLPFFPSILFLTGIWLLGLSLPILLFAWSRSKGRPDILFPLTFLYFVYGWARVFSLFDILWKAVSL
jgi:GT2 family glycosyltransferase